MDPMHVLLRRVQRRLALYHWLDRAIDATFYTAVAACVYLVLARMFPLLADPGPVAATLFAVALAAATGYTIWRRPTLQHAALAADNALGLRERFSSSLALDGQHGPMLDALHRDARTHAERIDLRQSFRYRPTRLARWLAAPLFLFGAGYVLLPEFDLFGYEERQLAAKTDFEARAVQAQRLAEAAKKIESLQPLPKPETDAVVKELEKVAAELQRGGLSLKQALAKVNNLSEKLAAERQALREQHPQPNLQGDINRLGQEAKAVAKAMQEGKFGEAAEKLRQMQEKLESGELSEAQKQQLGQDMKSLSKMMQGDPQQSGETPSELAQALSEAGEGLEKQDLDNALDQLKQSEMSMEQMASAMEQLEQLEQAKQQIQETQQAQLGKSPFCRSCGKKLEDPADQKMGQCQGGSCQGGGDKPGSGQKPGQGAGKPSFTFPQQAEGDAGRRGNGGMNGPGQGAGNAVGELPDDVQTAFEPSILPGGMSKGKIIASVMQRTAPDGEEAPTVEYVEGTFVEVQQAAEEALTKEEIPAGSREFVRQYFGAIDPATAE